MSLNKLLILLLLVLFAACQPESHPVQGTAFYFYPKPNVYYDIEQKQYYSLSPTTQQWEQKASLNATESAGLGEKVLIDTPGIPVYKDNAHHRLVYSAALYASPEDLRRKYEQDSISSLPPEPTKPEVERKEEKKRTKVGKFLNRIFGKKDKG
jgi:hypothetical protein